MKKKLFKICKGFLVFIVVLIAVIYIALVWPISKIKVPKAYSEIVIKSANIIDVLSGKVLSNRDVLIKNNRIITIDSISITPTSESALVIDAKGKYIIPGLWNMHSHSTTNSEWLHHPLYIANGVTGLRDMSGQLDRKDSYWVGSKERLQWNQDLEKNTRITPRYILQSSYQIDGKASVPEGFPEFFKLQKVDDIKPFLDFYKNQKVDFIKVYMKIPPDSYRKLLLEAPNYAIHVAGHKPIYVSLEEAVNLGQRSFEHGRIFMYECFPGSDSLRVSKNVKNFYSKSKQSMVSNFDTQKALRLMDLMKEKNAYWTPTLQTLKSDAFAHKKEFLDNSNIKYVPFLKRKLWWGSGISNAAKKNQSTKEKGLNTDVYRASQKQVGMAKKRGVLLMAGTDVTDIYVFPGFSLHTELKDLTECGLSNLEALQTATINPAKYARLENDFGTLEQGKMADIVILDKNPLLNIENTKSIRGVLINGMYYDRNKINELKDVTSSIASSFHINIKEVYNLLASPLIRVQLAD